MLLEDWTPLTSYLILGRYYNLCEECRDVEETPSADPAPSFTSMFSPCTAVLALSYRSGDYIRICKDLFLISVSSSVCQAV